MNPNDRELWLDVVCSQYLEAVESQDFATQEKIWLKAGKDSELEAALNQMHLGWLEEAESKLVGSIMDSATKHLKSATVVKPASEAVTVADVAEELFSRPPEKLPAEAHLLNEKLRQMTVEVPATGGLKKLIAWAEEHFGSASVEYWRAFHHAAMKLRMQRTSEIGLAARRAKRKGEL